VPGLWREREAFFKRLLMRCGCCEHSDQGVLEQIVR
jgi:hypothetical protein